MSVSFILLWSGNIAFGLLTALVYVALMGARSITRRDRTLDEHSDWLEFVAEMTVTVAIGLAFAVDAKWLWEVFAK